MPMRVEMRWHRQDGKRLPVAVWQAGPGYRSMSGLGPGVLTLTLPARPPGVTVPVAELFLEPGR